MLHVNLVSEKSTPSLISDFFFFKEYLFSTNADIVTVTY